MKIRQAKGHPELLLTDDGRVFKEARISHDRDGYAQLWSGYEKLFAHQLMCETWHGPRPEGCEVRHLDGDKDNNHPKNLAWGTRLENAQDRVTHGRSKRGAEHHYTKLTKAQVLEIRARRMAGEPGLKLAREFGVSDSTIHGIYTRRTWRYL